MAGLPTNPVSPGELAVSHLSHFSPLPGNHFFPAPSPPPAYSIFSAFTRLLPHQVFLISTILSSTVPSPLIFLGLWGSSPSHPRRLCKIASPTCVTSRVVISLVPPPAGPSHLSTASSAHIVHIVEVMLCPKLWSPPLELFLTSICRYQLDEHSYPEVHSLSFLSSTRWKPSPHNPPTSSKRAYPFT